MTSESAIDSRLVRDHGIKSYNEIALETGLEPDEVARRTEEIFDRVSISPEKMAAKNIFQLQEIVAKQMERVANAKDEDVARLGNTAAGAIGRLQAAVEKMLEMQSKNTLERDEAYSRALAGMVDKAMQRAIGELKQRHPELDAAELGEVLETHLVEIAVEMDQA